MKKVIFSILLIIGFMSAVWAYTYETKVPLPGKSIAGEKVQQETLFTAYSFAHRIAAADCTSFAITDTQVSKPKADNAWQEIWSVKACEKTALVPIDFSVSEDGKVRYAINPMNVRYAK